MTDNTTTTSETNDEGHVVFNIVTESRFLAPVGTTFEELPGGHGAFILPDGTHLKSYVVLEKDEMDDLGTEELSALGCELEDLSRVITETE